MIENSSFPPERNSSYVNVSFSFFKGVVQHFLLKGGDEGRYFLLSRHLHVMFSCCCFGPCRDIFPICAVMQGTGKEQGFLEGVLLTNSELIVT